MPFSLNEVTQKPERGRRATRPQRPTQLVKNSPGLAPYLEVFYCDPAQEITALKITTVIALLCSLGLSWRLWVSSRLFPLCPVTDALPDLSFPLDYVWFFSLLGLLLSIICFGQSQKLILAFLALAGLLSLWDQNRWQPWFYQYCFLLAALGVYTWKEPGAPTNKAALNVCRLILVSTYFWSGLQKLNVIFVRETWPDIARGVLTHLPEAVSRLPPLLILTIPLLEMSIGVGLLTAKFRRPSVLLAIATHLFVLILLVISGENIVVWPWNIAMSLFVVILFWRDETTGPRQILMVNKGFPTLVLLLFGIMPAFSLLDRWDSYLSAALYSGNTTQAVIYVSPGVMARLPASIRPHVWQSTQPFFLDINRWSYGELNVPIYPEPRIYRKVADRICSYTGDSPDVRLRIKGKPNPLTGARKSAYYDCDHLNSTE